ncbi:MAG TPA: GFA family protein [Steroidobacteraceae bacterium]|jgi:hypothetical protein
MQTPNFPGGCLCGQVRYEASGDVTNLCFCHCTSCRRAAGAPMVPWGSFEVERFRIVRGQPAQYCSSPGVRRGFCGQCGTTLTYFHEQRADELDVTLASLDVPGVLRPEVHIWVEDKLPWVVIADGRPQFAKTRS